MFNPFITITIIMDLDTSENPFKNVRSSAKKWPVHIINIIKKPILSGLGSKINIG